MKKIILYIYVIPFMIFSIGCMTYPHRPTPAGSIITNCDGPVSVTSSVESNKKGESSARGVLNLIAWGDASINTAAKYAGITKIHHVDYEHFRIILPVPYVDGTYTIQFIPIYEKFTTKVYGK